jgi:IclR family KDG regulon transcriptional repressor
MPKRSAHASAPAVATEKIPGTAAFAKFVTVLQHIADAPGELGMADLCAQIEMPRPTVYRIIAALRAEGFIDGGEKLALGPRLISLASRSWGKSDLRLLAQDDLRALRDRTEETVHLAVPSDREMVYIDKLESPKTVRMTSRIGTRVLLHASSVGKAFLAALPLAEQQALLEHVEFRRITPRTIMRLKDLEAELQRTRRRGYAIDREETELQIHCLGAAVRNRGGRPVAGISVTVPTYRYGRAAERTFPALIVECAERISARYTAAESPA